MTLFIRTLNEMTFFKMTLFIRTLNEMTFFKMTLNKMTLRITIKGGSLYNKTLMLC
jgi:hypothetical protein